MKNRCIAFALALFVICFFAACSAQSTPATEIAPDPTTENVASSSDIEVAEEDTTLNDAGMEFLFYGNWDSSFAYYRETITDVMYVRFEVKVGYAGMGGLTVMLDPESGLPLTYTRYLELASRTQEES